MLLLWNLCTCQAATRVRLLSKDSIPIWEYCRQGRPSGRPPSPLLQGFLYTQLQSSVCQAPSRRTKYEQNKCISQPCLPVLDRQLYLGPACHKTSSRDDKPKAWPTDSRHLVPLLHVRNRRICNSHHSYAAKFEISCHAVKGKCPVS